MDVIYILLPVALVIVIIIIAIFLWAVRSDQFDDLEGPAHRILMDDDDSERKINKTSPPSDKAPD
ncbi:MAG: cbb3-type cytochrome oxidase assembly protein CcoS [Gammaproteobacteria bacterium]|nr:cbb3-type cytochrome oxidase assembly protein CcoS [Gammaproteobacteria bacterium]NNJ51391.1 cbb3-type cytochrome oxidase assembly protein CcoS [Gammaproteobacteria bacterium]